jgi:hypothetical protein
MCAITMRVASSRSPALPSTGMNNTVGAAAADPQG